MVALLEYPILQSLARLLSKSRLDLGAGLRGLAAAACRRNDAIRVTTRRVKTRGPGRVEGKPRSNCISVLKANSRRNLKSETRS